MHGFFGWALGHGVTCLILSWLSKYFPTTLSETNSSPLKIGRVPIGNSSEPSIDFQGPPNSLLVFEGGYLMT